MNIEQSASGRLEGRVLQFADDDDSDGAVGHDDYEYDDDNDADDSADGDAVDDDDADEKMVIWCTQLRKFHGPWLKATRRSALGPKLLHPLNLDCTNLDCTNLDCTNRDCTNRETNHSQ